MTEPIRFVDTPSRVRVVCLVTPTPDNPGGVSFTWTNGPDAFSPLVFDKQLVEIIRDELVKAVREHLQSLVEAYVEAVNSGRSNATDEPEVRRAGLALAQAGHELRTQLFRPGKDPDRAAAVADWLSVLHARDAIESLELLTDTDLSIPWNLLYETEPDEDAFLQAGAGPDHWLPFWGLRYNLAGGQRVDPRRRMPLWHTPKVLLVADAAVLAGLREHPEKTVREQFERLEAFRAGRGLEFVDSRAKLQKRLKEGRPDLLYWLGHTGNKSGWLVLGDEEVSPADLRKWLAGDGRQPPGGLVFLNACQTAGATVAGGSFLDSVLRSQMGGVIATEQVVLDTFANALGLDFLEAILAGGQSVGTIMRELRGRVPLGLLYGTYCPPEICVIRPGQQGTGTTPALDTTAPAAGKKLGIATASCVLSPLPSHPYRSLRAYGVRDRALFAGRDDDILRFAQILDAPDTRLVILHGESGVGKTSFLRAGVIPYLETDCIGYRFARNRGQDQDPILMVRATNDPVGQIAGALTAYCARPFTYTTPRGDEITLDLAAVLRGSLEGSAEPDALRTALRVDPALLGRVLSAVATPLPFTPVLVIDQAEEVFTLARTPADEENRIHALEMLRQAASGPGGFKLVVSLRTEYHGRFVDRLRTGTSDTGGVREYLLTDFGLDALTEVIRRPTSAVAIPHASEVPFEKYRFRYVDGVAEELARRLRAHTLNRQDSVLPLAQVICTQLYDLAKTRSDGVVTLADLEQIGGVEGGMKRHAEEMVRRLFPVRADQQRAFKHLLCDDQTQLYIRQSDGTLTTALVPAAFLARHWSGRVPFEQVLAAASDGDWRVLRVNSLRIGADEQEQPYVSLGHDALAPVAAEWKAEFNRWRRMRAQLVRSLAILLVFVGVGGFAWWWDKQATTRRHETEARDRDDRERADRNGDAIKSLIGQCEAALRAGDAAKAAVPLAEAERRSGDPGAEVFSARLARCRADLDLLRDLDRADDVYWITRHRTVLDNGSDDATQGWEQVFEKLGVTTERMPSGQALELVNSSLIRERLIYALDRWLLIELYHKSIPDELADRKKAASIKALVQAADPDQYRNRVRNVRAIITFGPDQDLDRDIRNTAGLYNAPEAADQPTRFALILTGIYGIPKARREEILLATGHRNPNDFTILMELGNLALLEEPRQPGRAVAWYQAAVALQPNRVIAWQSLGLALWMTGDLKRAASCYQHAAELDQTDASLRASLGSVLLNLGELDRAEAAFNATLRLAPLFPKGHKGLGDTLLKKGDRDGAIRHYREAMLWKDDQTSASASEALAEALTAKGDLDGAIASYKPAIEYYRGRVQALSDSHVVSVTDNLGYPIDSKTVYKPNDKSRAMERRVERLERLVTQFEEWRALRPRLEAVVAGRAQPSNPAESCRFGELCAQHFERRYAAAARLFAAGFAADTRLADDLSASRRYAAACSAVQAGCGQGVDAPADPTARAALRGQALAWLQAELKSHVQQFNTGTPSDRQEVAARLNHWLIDSDLSGVRGFFRAAALPPEEATQWRAFWAEARRVREEASKITINQPG